MRPLSWALALALVALLTSPVTAQQRNFIRGCTILTPADLDAAKVDFILETSCSKELYQSVVNRGQEGGGTVMVFTGTSTTVLAAFNQDLADYRQLGPSAVKPESIGERSYFANLGDGNFVIGFVKGTYYFKFAGGGETPAERKTSEAIGRTLSTRFAGRH